MIRNIKLLFVVVAVAGLVSASSCTSSQNSPASRVDAESAFDKAEAAFEQEDYATAESNYAIAVEGGLPVDLLGPAFLKRGIALGHLGRYEEAMKSIDEGAQGVGDQEVKEAKAQVLLAQGDTEGAKQVMKGQ